jgi:hypothetical protein
MSCGGNVRRYARRPGVEALSCFRLGSTASVLRCPRYVRLASNFGRLDVSVKSTLRAKARSRCAPARCAGARAERPVAG